MAAASAAATRSGEFPGIDVDLVYNLPTAKPMRAYKQRAGQTDIVDEMFPVRMRVHDARALPTPPTLATMGFELIHAPTALSRDEFLDDAKVKSVYYPEAALAIEALTGAARVLPFHHLIRSSSPKSKESPAGVCHSDYSPLNALGMFDSFARPAEHSGRFAIINLWKPISGPVLNHHLAMCDGRTVTAPDDMLHMDFVDGANVSGTFRLDASRHVRHKWFYFPRMETNELLMFMQYDSNPTAATRFCFHSSITDPTAPADAPPRESIELRCVAFFPDHPENTIPPSRFRARGGAAGCVRKIMVGISYASHWPKHAQKWVRSTVHGIGGLETVVNVIVSEGAKKGDNGLHLITPKEREEVKRLLLTQHRSEVVKLFKTHFPPLAS